MNCKRVVSLLSEYQDGALGSWTRNRISRHLDSCPSCRREVEHLERLGEILVPELSPAEPSADFADMVMRRLPVGTRPALSGPSLLPRLAWSAVAACVLLVCLYLATHHTSGTPSRDIPVAVNRAPKQAPAPEKTTTTAEKLVNEPESPKPNAARESAATVKRTLTDEARPRRRPKAGFPADFLAKNRSQEKSPRVRPAAREGDDTDLGEIAVSYGDIHQDAGKVRLVSVPIGKSEPSAPGSPLAGTGSGSAAQGKPKSTLKLVTRPENGRISIGVKVE